MKVLIDTNVLVSAALKDKDPTIRAQGAPTIYPLVCTPVDKVFCLCSSVCVERAQRAGGKFSSSRVTKATVMNVWVK